MSVAAEKQTRLLLKGPLVLGGIASLKEQLNAALDAGMPVLIDAEGVESTDTAAVQLLAVFVGHAKKSELWSGWIEPGEVIRDAARRLHLDQHLFFEDGVQS